MKSTGFIPILLIISFYATGQGKSQKELEKDFVIEYCECLEKFSSQEPEKVLYGVTENCVRDFFNKKGKEVEQVIATKEGNTTLSDYEKGRALGKEIIYNTIDDLVKDCKLYRRTLSEYKAMLIGQLKITKESAESSITEFKSKQDLMKDDKSLGTFFTLLGIMYEFVGNKKEASDCYDKALQYYPSTQAKGLRLLLKIE